jgi:hypothetical protein
MTWSGPCLYHCGSRVNVGVNVKVGRGVSEGRRVDVFVGKNIGVRVAGGVGKGSGLVVQVAAMIAVGEATRLNPPHPTSRSVNPDIPARIFRKCYRGWFKSQRMRKPSSVSQGAMI